MTQPDPSAQSGAADPQSGVAGQAPTVSTTAVPAEPAAQSGQQPTTTTVSQADYEALQRRMQAADQNAAKLQQQLKAQEDAKLSEQERTVKALDETKAALTAAQEQIKSLNLQIAFLSDNTYTWQDPSAARTLIDMTGIELDAEGKPKNLKEALDALAKKSPWLIKPAEGSGQQVPAASIPPMNNGQPPNVGGNRSQLEDKFPALRGRVPKRS